jgi:hypothetical protein
MLRILLTIVLPVLLPLLLYLGYVKIMRHRAEAAGQAFDPRLREGPLAWLAVAGLGLVLAVLISVRLMTGVPPGTELEAPQLIDGEIVPSRVAE